MLMAMFGHAVLGLCERARRTDSAYCRTTVGSKLNEVSATRLTSNSVCNKFAETCCCCAEGPQKWLAPRRALRDTDVHRVSRTIDVLRRILTGKIK
jgi:hypothetical protein